MRSVHSPHTVVTQLCELNSFFFYHSSKTGSPEDNDSRLCLFNFVSVPFIISLNERRWSPQSFCWSDDFLINQPIIELCAFVLHHSGEAELNWARTKWLLTRRRAPHTFRLLEGNMQNVNADEMSWIVPRLEERSGQTSKEWLSAEVQPSGEQTGTCTLTVTQQLKVCPATCTKHTSGSIKTNHTLTHFPFLLSSTVHQLHFHALQQRALSLPRFAATSFSGVVSFSPCNRCISARLRFDWETPKLFSRVHRKEFSVSLLINNKQIRKQATNCSHTHTHTQSEQATFLCSQMSGIAALLTFLGCFKGRNGRMNISMCHTHPRPYALRKSHISLKSTKTGGDSLMETLIGKKSSAKSALVNVKGVLFTAQQESLSAEGEAVSR